MGKVLDSCVLMEILKELGLTQREIMEELFLSRSTYDRLKKGYRGKSYWPNTDSWKYAADHDLSFSEMRRNRCVPISFSVACIELLKQYCDCNVHHVSYYQQIVQKVLEEREVDVESQEILKELDIGELIRRLVEFAENKGTLPAKKKNQYLRDARQRIRMTIEHFDDPEDILCLGEGDYFYKHFDIEMLGPEYDFYLALPRAYMDHPPFDIRVEKDCIPWELERHGYTDGLLEEARRAVARDFASKEKGTYFNNVIIGVASTCCFARTNDRFEEPILQYKLYKTDYYTHRVMEKLMRESISHVDLAVQELITTHYAPYRTSLGVSIIVQIASEGKIILTKRSTSAAYSEGKEWYYVSVTETISAQDVNAKQPIVACIQRGLEEELGITSDMYEVSDIRIRSAFYELNFCQDNIFAVVRLKDNVTFEDVRNNAKCAKDRRMEVAALLTLDNDRDAVFQFLQAQKGRMRAQTFYCLNDYIRLLDAYVLER